MITKNVHPFKEGELAGLKDESGEMVLPPAYERIDPFFGSFAKVIHRGKQGLIDRKGRLALGGLFNSVTIHPWGENIKYVYIIASEKKKGFILDGTNRFSGFRFDFIGHLVEDRAIVSRDRRFGYIDEDGRVAVPLQFFEAENCLNGGAAVIDREGLKFINPKGDSLQHEDDPFIPLLKSHPECDCIPAYDDPEETGFTPLRPAKFREKKDWEMYSQLTPDSVWFGRSDNYLYFYNKTGKLHEFKGMVNFLMISHDLLLTVGSKYNSENGSTDQVAGVRNIFGEVVIPEVFAEISYEDGRFKVYDGSRSMYLLQNGVFVPEKI